MKAIHMGVVISSEGVVLMMMKVMVARRRRGRRQRVEPAAGAPCDGGGVVVRKEERGDEGGGRVRRGMVGPAPPVNVQPVSIEFPEATVEGDNVAGVELLLLNEAAPAFGHNIALAAVPVGVSEAPQLAVPVLEVEEKPLIVGG